MENGWILLHRKLKNKGYYKKSQYIHLWLHILLSVNHEVKEFLWNGETVKVKAGQFITGRKELSKETGIPETTIERILKTLENGHEIGQQKTTKYRLITVLKWSEYQKRTSFRTTNGQQTDTNKELKEYKEISELCSGGNKMDIDYDTNEEIQEKPKSHKKEDVIKLAKLFDKMASEYSKRRIITPKSYFIVLNAINKHGMKPKGIQKLYEDWFNNDKLKMEDRVKMSWALGKDNINSFKVKN